MINIKTNPTTSNVMIDNFVLHPAYY